MKISERFKKHKFLLHTSMIVKILILFHSTFSMSDASKDASTINAQDIDCDSNEDENHVYESDVEQHFKSGKYISMSLSSN